MTALMCACQYGHTATAELLLAKGAEMEAKDKVRQEVDRG
jgi:ankyrin repeat protein